MMKHLIEQITDLLKQANALAETLLGGLVLVGGQRARADDR